MAKADFHNHSTASDGKLTPTQLVDLAYANGVRILALTDHDSTEGIAEARAAAARHEGFFLLPGVELSTDIEGDEVHILGYFSDEQLRNEDLQAELARFLAAEQLAHHTAEQALQRVSRLQAIAADLAVTLTPEQVAAVVVDHALAHLRANAACLAVLSGDGSAA